MSFDWLKPYMPRGLYGRAFLILLLPVISVMLVVSVIFVQRHFEGVTIQMARSVSREVLVLLDAGPDAASITRTRLPELLSVTVENVPPADVPHRNLRRWYDFTGVIVIREFSHLLPQLAAIDLPDDRFVHLYLMTDETGLRLTFDRRRVSASNPHRLLVNMVSFAFVMTIVSFLYLRNQLRPITRLAKAAEAFGRGRPTDYRPGGAVEVRAAGHAFLDMRARIERQIEQRTLMLSGVSHDLRTPITRLKLALSMSDCEDRAQMEQDVADMERLINEFLDFARGIQEGDPEPVDPVALMTQIVTDYQRTNAPVSIALIEGSGTVQLRPVAMRRAIENLIGNAVRYGTQAEVSVVLTAKTLRFRIEDDGPGIPREDREEAMKPFSRLDSSRNQNLGSGVGLGLAIALDIARAHGGTLRLGQSLRLGGLQADIVIAR